MTFEEVYTQLEAWGSERGRAINARQGAGENQFGCLQGDLRKLAKTLKKNHALGLELWATGNSDARILATMILDPKALSADEFEAMVQPLTYDNLLDKLVDNVIALSPHADALRERWRHEPEESLGRAGWKLVVARVSDKKKPPLDVEGLLAEIEAGLRQAAPRTQWAMNHALVAIAVRHPELRDRCVGLGERLGVYAEMKVAKGCTSTYAPAWIAAVTAREK